MRSHAIRVTFRLNYHGEQSLGGIVRSLMSLSQLYEYYSLVEIDDRDHWEDWLSGNRGWLRGHDLTLRTLHYGSPTEGEGEVNEADESKARKLADAVQKIIEVIRAKRDENRPPEEPQDIKITNEDIYEIFPEIVSQSFTEDLIERVAAQLRLIISGLIPVQHPVVNIG